MTTKTRTADGDFHEDDEPVAEVAAAFDAAEKHETAQPVIADRLVALDGLVPAEQLKALSPKFTRVTTTDGTVMASTEGEETVLVGATPGLPLDQVVVDGHAYNGQWVDGAWFFTPRSLEMACRVVGWSTVEQIEPGRLRLK